MPEDGQTPVQPVAPSTGETTPEPVQETKPVIAIPSIEAQLAEMKAELAKATEASKREIQSAKDRAAAEISRHLQRANIAENTLKTVTNSLRDNNPAIATEIELAQLRTEAEVRKATEQQNLHQQALQENQNRLFTNLQKKLEKIGVKPDDPKLEGIGRGMANWDDFEVAVIEKAVEIKKEQDKVMSANDDKVTKLEKENADLRKQLNLESNSVDSGSPGSSVSDDKRVFTVSEINELSKDWKTNKEKIIKAQKEGRIKE